MHLSTESNPSSRTPSDGCALQSNDADWPLEKSSESMEDRIASAFDHFGLLTRQSEQSASLKRDIKKEMGLHFYTPPVVHKKFAFDRTNANNKLTDAVLSSHIGCVSDLHQIITTLPLQESMLAPTTENLKKEKNLHGQPVDLEQCNNLPKSLNNDSNHRICMMCWSGLGTMFCDSCSSILCGPCAVASHSEGPKAGHIISVVCGDVIGATEATPGTYLTESVLHAKERNVGVLEQTRQKQTHQPKLARHQHAYHYKHIGKSPQEILNYCPLPDPNFALPPVSKSVARINKIKPVECQSHSGCAASSFCADCGFAPLCDVCRDSESHRHHRCCTPEKAAIEVKSRLVALKGRLKSQISQMTSISKNMHRIKKTSPALVRAAISKMRQSFQSLFEAFSFKYKELHSQFARMQLEIAITVKNLSDDNLQFRTYLIDKKVNQLRSLVNLGDRNPLAGLNAWILMKPSLEPLLSSMGRFLIDGINPVHPWWTLNPSGARSALKPVHEKLSLQIIQLQKLLTHLGSHLHRVLIPTHHLLQHPISLESYSQIKNQTIQKAKAISHLNPLLLYTGPMPHTPEFSKLLPDLEGFVYRKDPLNDWGIVTLTLISPFLISCIEDEGPNSDGLQKHLKTDSIVSLLEEGLEIKKFNNPKISDMTLLAIERAKTTLQLAIVDGFEILKKKRILNTKGTNQEIITGYWLYGSDTLGAIDIWMEAIGKIQTTYPQGSEGHHTFTIPSDFPGVLPLQVGVQNISVSNRFAAIESFGMSSRLHNFQSTMMTQNDTIQQNQSDIMRLPSGQQQQVDENTPSPSFESIAKRPPIRLLKKASSQVSHEQPPSSSSLSSTVSSQFRNERKSSPSQSHQKGNPFSTTSQTRANEVPKSVRDLLSQKIGGVSTIADHSQEKKQQIN